MFVHVPPVTSWRSQLTTHRPMIVNVTTGGPPRTFPPSAVRCVGAWRAASRTQSTHWTPTAAGRWHSGHAGRPHRWHRTYAMRSGCRGQTGGGVGAGPGCGWVIEASGLERDRLDHHVLDRAVARAGARGGDRVHDRAALVVQDLAEDRVLAVEVRRLGHGDEELRAVRAAHLARDGVAAEARVRHREQVRLGEPQLGVDLVVEGVAGAAGPTPERVTALDHEAVDDAVEDDPVVQGGAGARLARRRVGPLLLTGREAAEVLHGLRGVVLEELQADVATVRVQGRVHARHPVTRTCGSAG